LFNFSKDYKSRLKRVVTQFFAEQKSLFISNLKKRIALNYFLILDICTSVNYAYSINVKFMLDCVHQNCSLVVVAENLTGSLSFLSQINHTFGKNFET